MDIALLSTCEKWNVNNFGPLGIWRPIFCLLETTWGDDWFEVGPVRIRDFARGRKGPTSHSTGVKRRITQLNWSFGRKDTLLVTQTDKWPYWAMKSAMSACWWELRSGLLSLCAPSYMSGKRPYLAIRLLVSALWKEGRSGLYLKATLETHYTTSLCAPSYMSCEQPYLAIRLLMSAF